MLKILSITMVINLLAWMYHPSEGFEKHANTPPVTIDGPYVMYRGDSILVYYIDSAREAISLRTQQWQQSQRDHIQLVVHTDEAGRTFNVKLHPKLSTEKNTYGKPKKMLVMSDIEGDFSAMRKLLQGNGVMDVNYRWTFGEGHLVLLGDFVDRGPMVTEVLWLIYSLESQAEAVGGKVHFILGNHEVMNMSGTQHYVHPRYLAHAEAMNIPYPELLGQQAELGRWLSTKNIAERVGNTLFSHAGFSTYMNQVQMSLKAINDTARLYYFDTSSGFSSFYAELIYTDFGPLWYRGYYNGNPSATMAQVDSTLEMYDSRFIVTGHTLISKEILSFFDGKVICIDVPHKLGYSEALLYEGAKMYRVNAHGEKTKIAGKH